MKDHLVMLLVGLLMCLLSVPSLLGREASIKERNRRGVSRQDMPAYCRMTGVGTLTIGVAVTITAGLLMVFDLEALYWLTAAGCAIGLGVIVYAQAKYRGRWL